MYFFPIIVHLSLFFWHKLNETFLHFILMWQLQASFYFLFVSLWL